MELAVITAKQVAELLLMILAGAACCKAGVFKPKEKTVLANLLLYLVVPVSYTHLTLPTKLCV